MVVLILFPPIQWRGTRPVCNILAPHVSLDSVVSERSCRLVVCVLASRGLYEQYYYFTSAPIKYK
jgi:hypothetical protein